MAKRIYAYDGDKFVSLDKLSIDPDNLAFGRSFGVFDFMRAENYKFHFLEDHLNRFKEGQHFLFGRTVYSKKVLRGILSQLQKKNKLKDSTFKLILSGIIKEGTMHPYLIIINKVYIPYDIRNYTHGARMLMEEYTREHAQYKSIYYLNTFRAFNKMKKAKAIDILFYNEDIVTEASRSNVFIVKNNAIYTPESTILQGITRKKIIEYLGQKFAIQEQDFNINELLDADEVFISSTLKKIMPVVKVGEYSIADGKVGPITNRMMVVFQSELDKIA